MKKILSMFLCLMLVFTGGALADTISVTGSATVSAVPDSVVIRLGAEVTRDTVAEAQKELNVLIHSILEAIAADEEIVLPDDAIRTEDYDIYAQYEYKSFTGEQVLAGYCARSMLQISTDQMDQAGRIIDTAFAAGANRMDGVTFQLKDSAEVSDQALILALGNATHKAELIAEAMGIPLEGMKKHVENTGSYGGSVANKVYLNDMAMEESATAILGGSLSFTVSVEITYTDE